MWMGSLDLLPVQRVLPLALLVAALASGCAEPARSVSSDFVEWAAGNAIAVEKLESQLPATDIESFREMIGSARLVGIGESRHDTHEQLLLKTLLVRHLIEDLDFRTLILEESFAHVEPLDRYITTGEGDLREIMKDLAGWYLLDTEEMLEFVQWVRQVNEGRPPGRYVRIFGMDITAPATAVQDVLKSLDVAGVELQLNPSRLGLNLQQGDFWPSTWERYAAISDGRRNELAEAYRELIAVVKAERTGIVAAFSESDYERTVFLAEIGRVGNDFFSSTDRAQAGAIRESGMAMVIAWIRENEVQGDKAILWAHNLHVAKSSFRMPGFVDGTLEPMGVLLSKELGHAYMAIGGSFGTGSFPPDLPPGERLFEANSEDVMDGALAAVGVPFFLVDLREAEEDPAVIEWLGQERAWLAQDSTALLVPITAFDLVYFVKEISRSQPTPEALRKYQTLGSADTEPR
jgi:erythromycin esterase